MAQVFPTKSNLMAQKRSLALASQGYDLMDRKRNILVREMMELMGSAAQLQGEIDHHGAGQLREAIDDSVRRACPRLLVLDLGGVEFMDSSGIGLVLGRYRLMQDLGGKLALRNLPPHIRRVMRVAGIGDLDIQSKGGERL